MVEALCLPSAPGSEYNPAVRRPRFDRARRGLAHHAQGELPDRDAEQRSAGTACGHPMPGPAQEVHADQDPGVEPALVPAGLHVWGGLPPQACFFQ